MSHDLLGPAVRTAIKAHNIVAKTIACDPELADTAAFCEHYGFSPDQSANTIIVASRTEPATYVACLVLANSKLDVNKKVRELTGIKKLSFASGEQTVALTGMMIGGVTIVGLPESLPIYIDKAVMEQPEIIIGGGNRSSKLILAPTELGKIPGMQIVEHLGLPR